MTVSELIELLKGVDQDYEVVIWSGLENHTLDIESENIIDIYENRKTVEINVL